MRVILILYRVCFGGGGGGVGGKKGVDMQCGELADRPTDRSDPIHVLLLYYVL